MNTPTHVAIIMDGNRRWANKKDAAHIEGHKEALKRIEELVAYSAKIGVKYLTLWAWSTKNWKRNQEFINDIISLFRHHLCDLGIFGRAIQKGAKIHHIGTLEGFPQDIQKNVPKFLIKNPKEKKIDLNLAVGYEGRDEIIRAIKKSLPLKAYSLEQMKKYINELSIDSFSNYLDTADQPNVDFMIRTGGDLRTSGFLLWQASDAEMYFTKTLFPDFSVKEYQKALRNYSKRERRFGGDSKRY